MKLADLFEDEDDWEPEVEAEPWKSFKVQPREGTDGWTSWMATSKVFDLAFGSGKWGIAGQPVQQSFTPMKVSIKPDAKINYAVLRDHGFKIVFFEGNLEYRKVHRKEDMPDKIHLDKSFYLQRHAGKPFMTYDVKQFLDDENIAAVYVLENGQNSSWAFKPNTSRFKNPSERDNEVFVSPGQVYNALKLKWWVTNRLISLGVLPPKTMTEGAISIPQGIKSLPKKIVLGTNGYYLELIDVKPTKATYQVQRMLSSETPMMTATISKRSDVGNKWNYLIQAHGSATLRLNWSDRSLMQSIDEKSGETPTVFDVDVIKNFMKKVVQASTLPKD